MLIFSVHGDTNFKYHTLKYLENGDIEGHMDNFAGVRVFVRNNDPINYASSRCFFFVPNRFIVLCKHTFLVN